MQSSGDIRRIVLERVCNASCFLTAQFSDQDILVDAPNPHLSFENFISSLKGRMQILNKKT